jgi:putative OmpL-like beta-barrel porin-2
MRTQSRKIAAVVASPLILVLSIALTQAQHASAQTQAPPDAAAIQKQLDAMEAQIAALKAALAAQQAAPAAPAAPAPAEAQAAPPAAPPKPREVAPFSDWDWTWLNGNPRNKDVAFDSPFFTPEIRADLTYTYNFNKPMDDSMGGSSELFRANEIQLEQLGIGGNFHKDGVEARFMTQFGSYSTATIRNDPSPAKGQWNLDNADRYLAEAYGGYNFAPGSKKWVRNGLNIDAGIFMSYIGLFSYYNYDNWAYQPSYVSSNTPWFFQGIRVQYFPTAHLKIEPWFINGWQSYGSSNMRKGVGGQIKYTPFSWFNIISNNYGLGHDDLYTPDRGRIHTDNSYEFKYYDKPNKFWDKSALSITLDAGCEFGPSGSVGADRGGGYEQGVSCLGGRHDKNSIGENDFADGYASLVYINPTTGVQVSTPTPGYIPTPVAGPNGNDANPNDVINGQFTRNSQFNPNPRYNVQKVGTNPKQSFIGYMIYDRNWFDHDKYAITIGGGEINNPGRYLVLVPPIDGMTAASAALNSPYFPFNPGDPFKAWDSSVTFDYMPKQWLTFRVEYDFRHASSPYWAGHGGSTPPNQNGYSPGTNNGTPQNFTCSNGGSAPYGDSAIGASVFCASPAGGGGSIWAPDQRRDESLIDVDWMIKF